MAPRDILNEMSDDNNSVKGKKIPEPQWKVNDDNRRKSNVVKEIEKIQKNREQRRANQEEKRQKMNEVDQSVPAWEFAQMISDFRATLDFSKITNSEPVPDLRISVCVRKRPINKKGIYFAKLKDSIIPHSKRNLELKMILSHFVETFH